MSTVPESQPDAGADVEALAKVLGDIRVAGAREADWWTSDEDHRLLIQVLRGECIPWAEGLLASDWLAALIAAAEARGAAEALHGVKFRVEVACDGYAHLMDEDVPGHISDLAAYEDGAHDAAEAIRAALLTRAAPATDRTEATPGGGAHSLTDCWCGEVHRREDFL